MREITIKIYSFDELSQTAQEKAHSDYIGTGLPVAFSSEYRNTMKAFETAFNIRVHSWYVDQCGYSFRFYKNWQWDDGDGYFNNPLRFARWLWNNWADAIRYPRIYGRLSSDPATGKTIYKRRESKCTYTLDALNLTGFCADMDITDPIRACLHYEREYKNIDDLLNDCLDSFFAAWQAEYEYQESIEYFADMCRECGYEFTENGEQWTD